MKLKRIVTYDLGNGITYKIELTCVAAAARSLFTCHNLCALGWGFGGRFIPYGTAKLRHCFGTLAQEWMEKAVGIPRHRSSSTQRCHSPIPSCRTLHSQALEQEKAVVKKNDEERESPSSLKWPHLETHLTVIITFDLVNNFRRAAPHAIRPGLMEEHATSVLLEKNQVLGHGRLGFTEVCRRGPNTASCRQRQQNFENWFRDTCRVPKIAQIVFRKLKLRSLNLNLGRCLHILPQSLEHTSRSS